MTAQKRNLVYADAASLPPPPAPLRSMCFCWAKWRGTDVPVVGDGILRTSSWRHVPPPSPGPSMCGTFVTGGLPGVPAGEPGFYVFSLEMILCCVFFLFFFK